MDNILLQSWAEATVASLQQVWEEVVAFLPKFLGLGLVFVIGLIMASVISNLVQRFFDKVKIDSVLSGTGIDKEFERSGVQINLARFFARLTYWLLLIATIILVTNGFFGPGTVVSLLQPVLDFIPKVAKAVIILLGTVLLANFLKRVAQAATTGAKVHMPSFVASLAWWSVAVFGFLTALTQLDIATQTINTLIMGVIAMLAIAGGIAFGLGGKDAARDWIDKMKS